MNARDVLKALADLAPFFENDGYYTRLDDDVLLVRTNDSGRFTLTVGHLRAARDVLAVTDAPKGVADHAPAVEALAKMIDPEAWGLPNNVEADTITDRDEARDRARVILRFLDW